MIKEVDSKAT